MNNSKNKNILDECMLGKKIIMNLRPFMAMLMTGELMPWTESEISDKLTKKILYTYQTG